MTKNEALRSLLKETIDKCEKQIDTCEKLIELTHLSELTGVPMNDMGKTSFYWYWPREKDYISQWKHGELNVTLHKGSDAKMAMVFPWDEVPLEIWPAEMRFKYERHLAIQAAKRMRQFKPKEKV